VLELEDVIVDYGAVRAVNEVRFSVEAGAVCGLVGPNGSGKSTLLNAISRLVDLSGGTIVVAGRDVGRARPHVVARQGVGRTFQHVRLLHGLTVQDNVAAGYYAAAAGSRLLRGVSMILAARKLAGEEKVHVEEAMERAGIADLATTQVDDLPFASQRRVEIARSIVSRPKLVLFDEPAAGLGLKDLEDLATIIQTEAQRGCAVVLVDHHLHFVLEQCPRLVVLNFGNKIFDGPSERAVEDQGVREAYVGG
jgi:ABC-type branched-subunit amino acid transport system ATPase component